MEALHGENSPLSASTAEIGEGIDNYSDDDS
jgi:hypothetical protein